MFHLSSCAGSKTFRLHLEKSSSWATLFSADYCSVDATSCAIIFVFQLLLLRDWFHQSHAFLVMAQSPPVLREALASDTKPRSVSPLALSYPCCRCSYGLSMRPCLVVQRWRQHCRLIVWFSCANACSAANFCDKHVCSEMRKITLLFVVLIYTLTHEQGMR